MTDRADDLTALVRLSAGPGAVGALLDWLARRAGGAAALLDVGGRTLATPARCPSPCWPQPQPPWPTCAAGGHPPPCSATRSTWSASARAVLTWWWRASRDTAPRSPTPPASWAWLSPPVPAGPLDALLATPAASVETVRAWLRA
ncbi:hypothetical protein, partial [Actinosynnema sp.]|uniref:hypothetical protein n=1 Tax=Actinosynnema sp. TaxID=1872144 RepID=UPI003F866EAB